MIMVLFLNEKGVHASNEKEPLMKARVNMLPRKILLNIMERIALDFSLLFFPWDFCSYE